MKISRRQMGLLLPALAATATASAQTTGAPAPAPGVEQLPVMKTRAYRFAELPVITNGKNKRRSMFTDKTHTGFKISSHMNEVAPGEVNHPPHQHLREEMMLIREGTIELTVNGKPYRLGPGDVGVIGSNEMHNAKNVGTVPAHYFIVNIGRDDV
jgi:mannose-6-phosphate isomerase-like protein (cupin superfamily)